jgi:hypothetical protein
LVLVIWSIFLFNRDGLNQLHIYFSLGPCK